MERMTRDGAEVGSLEVWSSDKELISAKTLVRTTGETPTLVYKLIRSKAHVESLPSATPLHALFDANVATACAASDTQTCYKAESSL